MSRRPGPAGDTARFDSGGWLPRYARLAAGVNLGLVGPLLDLLARQPAFFVAHQMGRRDAVLIGTLLSLGLPLLLLAVERLVGGRFGARVHRLWIVSLAALLGSRIAHAHGPGVALALAALMGGLAFGLLRRPAGRAFVATLGILSFVLPMRFSFSAGVASLAAAPALESAVEVRQSTPVLLIVFDELPLGSLLQPNVRINATLFPAFGELAAQATWYPNAITVAQATEDAVPAMLTGRYPTTPRQPTAVDHPRNLFSLLDPTFDVRALETASALCPIDICSARGGPGQMLSPALWSDLGIVLGHLVLPSVLVALLPPIDRTWAGFAEGRRKQSQRATSQIRQIDDARMLVERLVMEGAGAERPAFTFLHLQLPHTPWQFLPSGATYARRSRLGFMNRQNQTSDPWIARQARQRHLLQLVYVDRLLGEILDRLRRGGIFDRLLLIVTSDHGRAFLPDVSARGVTSRGAHAILPIPLFVKLPGQRTGRIDDRDADLVDIAPTILDVLDVAREEWQTDGTSLLDPRPPERLMTRVYRRPTRHRAEAEVYRVDRRVLAKRRLAPTRRLRRDFGHRPEDLFRPVPAPGLKRYLDRPLVEVEIVDVARTPRLVEPGETVAIEKNARSLPVYIAGTVDATPGDHRVHVAIAVDGIVRAITRSTVRKSGARQPFQAILPPSSLTPGDHRIEAVAIELALTPPE